MTSFHQELAQCYSWANVAKRTEVVYNRCLLESAYSTTLIERLRRFDRKSMVLIIDITDVEHGLGKYFVSLSFWIIFFYFFLSYLCLLPGSTRCQIIRCPQKARLYNSKYHLIHIDHDVLVCFIIIIMITLIAWPAAFPPRLQFRRKDLDIHRGEGGFVLNLPHKCINGMPIGEFPHQGRKPPQRKIP